jgi:ABC-type transporter Mla MlaB component
VGARPVTPSRTLLLEVYGPLVRSDLPGLYARTCRLLRQQAIDVVVCSVSGVAADAVAVDALARLQLAARRLGADVRVRGASRDLLALVDFMGLREALPEERLPPSGPD